MRERTRRCLPFKRYSVCYDERSKLENLMHTYLVVPGTPEEEIGPRYREFDDVDAIRLRL